MSQLWWLSTTPTATGCLTELRYEENHALVIAYDKLTPLPGTSTLSCTGEAVLPFDLRAAVSDPDGDTLFAYWFLNYVAKQKTQHFEGGEGVLETQLERCASPTSGLLIELNTVEVVIMDREPSVSNLEARVAPDGAFAVIVPWVVDVPPGPEGNTSCTCSAEGTSP